MPNRKTFKEKKKTILVQTVPWWDATQILRLKARGKEEGSCFQINIW